jgi:putative phosphoesterase
MPLEDRLRRIGVIGDIHCEDVRLEASLQFLAAQQLDMICTVGDIVDGPGDVNRTIESLIAHRVVAVRGNHERWLFNDEMRDVEWAVTRDRLTEASWRFLTELPLTRSYETVAGRMMLCHGLAEHDMGGVWPSDDTPTLHLNLALWKLIYAGEYNFIVNGHTHHRMVRSFIQMTIINAGTLHRKSDPCFCTADFGAGAVQYFNIDGDGKIEQAERYEIPH